MDSDYLSESYLQEPYTATQGLHGCTVAVIILNWNGGDDILVCIQSVFDSLHKQIEVVIVDNGSIDGSSERIRGRFSGVHFITNSHNLGFATGCNQGIKWALERRIPYVLLLNGDARVHPTMVGKLLEEAQRFNDKVVTSPKMYLGNEHTGANRLWFACGKVYLAAGLFRNPAYGKMDSPRWSVPQDMEYASGCCLLIPNLVVNTVGMLDDAFFAYCEDIDYSLRVRRAGFRLRYVPSACLWHGSSGPADRTRTPRYRYLSTRNNLWVVRRHGSATDILICFLVLPARSLFRVSHLIMSGNWSSINAELRGIVDGMFQRIG